MLKFFWKYLFCDYAKSIRLNRFIALLVIGTFAVGMGVTYTYLRFKVRDLKIAINTTDTRIRKLEERKRALDATLQSRVLEWSLKQTALQELGMVYFSPQRTIQAEWPVGLNEKYTAATNHYEMVRRPEEREEWLVFVLSQLAMQGRNDSLETADSNFDPTQDEIALAE